VSRGEAGRMRDRPMTFTEHLAELRSRLLKSIGSLVLAFVVAWNFHEALFHFIARPVLAGLRNHGIRQLQALQVTETVIAHLQASLLGALVLASPAIFYQVWAFVAPGLLQRERRVVLPVIGLLSAFFLLGVLFCYFVFLPLVVDFLVSFTEASGDVALLPTVQQTFRLAVAFLAVFGLVFELPLLMFFLSMLGVVQAATFRRYARHFVVFAFVIGAILTPPDPLSQVLMAVPLCALYLVGVVFAHAGETFRGSRRTAGASALAVGVFVAFAGAVGLASWYWNRPASPDLLPGLPGACLRLDCRLETPLGRACLRDSSPPDAAESGRLVVLQRPGDRRVIRTAMKGTDCPGAARDGFCVLEGSPEDLQQDTLPPPEPVRLRVEAPCAALIFPDLPGPAGSWTLSLAEEPAPLVTVRLRAEGPDADLWRSLPDGTSAPSRALAGTAAPWDWEVVEEGPDRLEAAAVLMPGRARRWVRDLSERLSAMAVAAPALPEQKP